MFENNCILAEMPNILREYFENPQEPADPVVVSLDFELALERQMAAMLTKPLEVSIK